MESKNQAKDRIHRLFQVPGNRENLALLYKFLSQPSKGLCLCKVMPEERLKILSFFEGTLWSDRIQHIDMVNPPHGPMELQQSIIDTYDKFGPKKDIFFIYNIEGSIRLLETTADEFFQRMNLVRDFFMQFEAEFVFFVTEPLENMIIQNAFDFYDWMKVTFTFTPEIKDLSRQPTEPEEQEKIEYSNPLDKIKYFEKAIPKVKNEIAKAIQQSELGGLYLQVGEYEKATQFLNNALEIFVKTNDRDNIEIVRANMNQVNRLKKDNKSVAPMDGQPFDWDELLFRIRHKNVIPVIGQGLYRVEVESKGISGVLLYDYLAEQVSKECDCPLTPGENHRFAKASLAFLKKTNNNYLQLLNFLLDSLKGARLVPVNPLWKLARIKSFAIFMTTAYDDFLLNTIKTVRDTPTDVLSYSIREKKLTQLNEGLFDRTWNSKFTMVYHLFGNMKQSIAPAYTEKDILETLLEFHKDMERFLLFKEKSFLFMGCGFDDWLYRFFIRIISNKYYGSAGYEPTHIYVADDFSNYKKDPSQELTRFLRDYKTNVFYTGGGSDFVDLLFEKIEKAYPEEIIPQSDFPAVVFLSFADGDRDAARRLAAHLREDGIHVWLDEVALKPGDIVDETILKAIDQCRVFIPLISKNSRRIVSGDARVKYHIREWEWAYSRNLSGKDITILPVKLDDDAWMYETFVNSFFFRIPGGDRGRDYEKLVQHLSKFQSRSAQPSTKR